VPTAIAPSEFVTWTTEARTILSEALETLQVFDDFQAFRVSTAPSSSMRLAAELAWDPPTGAAWNVATRIAGGLHGRADRLFHAISDARIDPTLWRERRKFADAAHDLVDLADALAAYRARVNTLPPGDAAPVLGLLEDAWTQFDTCAARWGAGRAEPIICG
jgi:hypothetical protein